MNPLVLAISYFFHLVATIVWIGGLALLVLVVWPVAGRTLAADPAQQAAFFGALRKRFDPLANLSLVVLVVTGLFQTSGDPNYGGMLVFDNDWSRAILLKHVAIVGMVVVGVVLQLGIAPALERMALQRALGESDPAENARLARREQRLNALNLALGLLVLAFTAVATAL
ncbi:MAG: CopD family protein [Anaerolineae bacterium]|nr:CopD family protein [Anaerolineae bacterium]